MATWHQQRSGRPPQPHATEWTVVVDPPNEFAYGMGFTTRAAAEDFMRKTPFSYILNPCGKKATPQP